MCAADAWIEPVSSLRPPLDDDVLNPCQQGSTESELNIVTTFRELGVLPEICDALERAGITTPFAIQEMTLSVALLGTDLIGQPRPGPGKPPAFAIPVLQRSVVPPDPASADLPQGKPQAL